jgi:hypothetical protein
MSRQPLGADDIAAPSGDFVAVTPADGSDLPNGPCRAIYVGTAGALSVVGALDSAPVTFDNLPVGVWPFRVVRVRSTGTTASGIVALY